MATSGLKSVFAVTLPQKTTDDLPVSTVLGVAAVTLLVRLDDAVTTKRLVTGNEAVPFAVSCFYDGVNNLRILNNVSMYGADYQQYTTQGEKKLMTEQACGAQTADMLRLLQSENRRLLKRSPLVALANMM